MTSIGVGKAKLVDIFALAGGCLFALSMLLGESLLFFVAAILVVLGVYPRVYLKYILKNFMIGDDREKLRLSIEENGSLQFVFANNSRLPLVNAQVIFQLDDNVEVKGVKNLRMDLYTFTISLGAKHTQVYEVPIEAVSRGIAKMKQLHVEIHDPLGIESKTLSHDFVRKSVVVYPKSEPVVGLERLSLPIEGERPAQSSIFQDFTAPVGTREYIPTDPLKNVHWKASARTGKLQTKLYEKTMGMTWTILILLDRELIKGTTETLEKELSRIAYICKAALKHGVDIELVINLRKMGSGLVVHLEPGSDRTHYIKAMEFLAYIKTNQIKTHPFDAFYEVDKSFYQNRVIMVVDHTSETEKYKFYSKWKRNGHQVLQLDEFGTLKSIDAGGDALAN